MRLDVSVGSEVTVTTDALDSMKSSTRQSIASTMTTQRLFMS